MYISSINIGKFRHLENERLGPFMMQNRSSELIAFAGPNGSGKSSVLELLSYALSNSYSLNWQLSRTFSDFYFEVGIGLVADEKKIVIDALQREISVAEAELASSLQSLDGRTDLAPDQLASLKQQKTENQKRSFRVQYEVVDYLRQNDIYYRAFNYSNGEYAKNSTLHNHLHSIATRELKDVLKRSLGFFLRADRHYPQKGFDQRRIFNYGNARTKEHLWTMAFNTSELQYQDMYEFLVQQRYHYLRELGGFHNRKNKGVTDGVEPSDPIKPYEDLLHRLFPHYKFADKEEEVPSNLFVEIPTGEIITFNDLSSGEKEVFFILSFFIRHNVENAVIVIDEPELHLHPELSRLLIRNMKEIRGGNQIWVATHNSEIIDEAGRDRVVYVARDPVTRKSRFIAGHDEQVEIAQLRELFGFAGYIGVAKNLVFLEGDNSSQDRKFYSAMFGGASSSFKLVPSNSSDHLVRLNSAVLAILQANLGWMDFYLIRDRDYLTPEMVSKYTSHASGKIFVLRKHEVENYLIDFEIISGVLNEIFGVERHPAAVKNEMHEVARMMSTDVLRDMVSFRLNLLVRPEDFSQGKFLANQPYFDGNGTNLVENQERKAALLGRFTATAVQLQSFLANNLSVQFVESVVAECEFLVRNALLSDDWMTLFPGKELLARYSKSLGIVHAISFQNSLIKEFSSHPERIDPELIEIFSAIG